MGSYDYVAAYVLTIIALVGLARLFAASFGRGAE